MGRSFKQTIEIEAVETPQVSSAIMQIPEELIRLRLEKKGRPSADGSGSSYDELELLVLIGADYYWEYKYKYLHSENDPCSIWSDI